MQNSVERVTKFFNYDLKIKKLVNDLIPNSMDFYDAYAMFKYADKILDTLDMISIYFNQFLLEYGMDNETKLFNHKMQEWQDYIKCGAFQKILQQGYDQTLNFVNINFSGMRKEFVDSVKNGFKGYYVMYGSDVLEPTTMNEFLHYAHSKVVNNEAFYSSVPIVQTTRKDNDDWRGISLRGISNTLGNQLFEGILTTGLDSDCIDIVNLENRMIIMARDLGHATVLEVDLTDPNNIFVSYFIPKNNNMEMVSRLKGVNVNNEQFATGNFLSTSETLVYDLCSLMKGIPTDFDMITSSFSH